jgi:hypothetical protein
MILVTGATGTVARPLIDLLASEGVKDRAVTHNPEAANLPAGVEVATGDLSRPDTIAPLLEGVTALFLHPRAVGLAAGERTGWAGQVPRRRWPLTCSSAPPHPDEEDRDLQVQGGSQPPWHGRAGTPSSPTSAPTTRRSRRRSASRWPTAGGRFAPDPAAAGTTASRAADSRRRGPVRVLTTRDTRTPRTASMADARWQCAAGGVVPAPTAVLRVLRRPVRLVMRGLKRRRGRR